MNQKIKKAIPQKENVKKTIPNMVKIILAFAAGLAIDPHTGSVDIGYMDIVINKVKENWEWMLAAITAIWGHDIFRKR